jgi:hypothetical protein
MFTPVARDSAAWERGYDRRTAVERVNSRIDRVLSFGRVHTGKELGFGRRLGAYCRERR